MPSDPALDIEALLAPIEGDNPCGHSIDATTIIADLKEFRRSDEAEALGEWAPAEIKTPSWYKVEKLATDVLTSKCKDIRVAGYLAEAMIALKGFAGLRDGLRLIRELHERYWDFFFPAMTREERSPDSDDYDDFEEDSPIEVRAAAIGQIDRLLQMPARSVKATNPKGGGTIYSQVDWDRANYNDNMKGKQQAAYDLAVSEGQPTGELFQKAVNATPRSFYERFVEDFDQCREELKLLNNLISDRYQEAEQSPVLSGVVSALDGVQRMIFDVEKLHGKLRKGDEPEAQPDQVDEATGEVIRTTRTAWTGEGIPLEPQDRDDAIRRLQAVASYFRRAEPHSPLSYLIERSIRWSSLSLDKWLEEVVKDATALATIRETLGIPPETTESSY